MEKTEERVWEGGWVAEESSVEGGWPRGTIPHACPRGPISATSRNKNTYLQEYSRGEGKVRARKHKSTCKKGGHPPFPRISNFLVGLSFCSPLCVLDFLICVTKTASLTARYRLSHSLTKQTRTSSCRFQEYRRCAIHTLSIGVVIVFVQVLVKRYAHKKHMHLLWVQWLMCLYFLRFIYRIAHPYYPYFEACVSDCECARPHRRSGGLQSILQQPLHTFVLRRLYRCDAHAKSSTACCVVPLCSTMRP